MPSLLQDVRYAARTCRAHAGFTLLAVATLALGIGATAAMFGIASTVLLRPLPYPRADRLALIWEFDRLRDSAHEGLSGPDYADLVARQQVFDQLAAWEGSQRTLTQRGGGAEPEGVTVAAVTHSFFDVFGRHAAVGRSFAPAEDRAGGARVALLNAGLWQQRFASNPALLGQTLTLDGVDHTIVGLFTEPLRMPSAATDVWVPLQLDLATSSRGRHGLGAAGRLKAGVTIDRAQADLAAIARQLEAEHPADNTGRGLQTNHLHDELARPVRLALIVLLGAVGAVLLIACANIASLLLSRAVHRVKEVSIRSALGATSARIVRQFLVEGLLLAGASGLIGLALAGAALDVLLAVAPIDLPRAEDVAIDGPVVLFTLGVTLATGLVFGLVPALQTLRGDLQGWLKENTRGASAGRASRRLRRLLVIGEIAVSAALLVGAALLIKSFWRLQRVDPGFRAAQVLKVDLQLPASRYPQSRSNHPNWPEVMAFMTQVLDRTRALPSVRSAALAANHPLDSGFTSRYQIAGRPPVPDGEQDEIRIRSVSPGYFATMNIPLRRGRWLDDRDRAGQPLVTLINEAAARRQFAGEDPVGQTIRFFGRAHAIVGVVGDERFMGLDRDVPPAVYPPLAQVPMAGFSLLLRGDADPRALVAGVRREVRAIDPALALYDIAAMEGVVQGAMATPRFSARLVGAFAAMAWLLAILGVHGVLSHAVAQRTTEIGVRVALGAQPRDVLRLVMREGLLVAGLGLGIGLGGALLGSRLLSTLLFAVDPRDVTVFASVAGALLISALLATWLPARRALRVDPLVAIRAE